MTASSVNNAMDAATLAERRRVLAVLDRLDREENARKEISRQDFGDVVDSFARGVGHGVSYALARVRAEVEGE